MSAWYFLVEQFDPNGPDSMQPGDTYGGEVRLYVIAEKDFPAALEALVDYVETEGCSLTAMIDADHVSEFDPDDDLPFEPDIEALTRDALGLGGEGFVSHGPRTFEPRGIDPVGIVSGLADVFDAENAGNPDNYAGELAEFVVKSDLHKAIRTLLEAQSHEGFALRGLLRVRDVAYSGLETDAELTDATLADAVRDMKDAPQDALRWGAIYEYGEADD